MRLILSDIPKLSSNIEKDGFIIENNGKMHNCIGCFGCWIKMPGECIIKDGYEDLGKQFGSCSELVIISKCSYGSFSPFIKNILDRSISYIHPYFKIINGRMHHKKRYDNTFKITTYFYGDNITDKERETADELIRAVTVNLHGTINNITFLNSLTELDGKI